MKILILAVLASLALAPAAFAADTTLKISKVHLCSDECVKAGSGPVGLTASELIDPARRIWNGWLRR